MRKVILAMLLMSCSALAQFNSGTARRFISGTPKPATCAVGDKWTDITASPATDYSCLTVNAWTAMAGGGGGAPSGPAGGDLAGTYPNPTVGQAHWTQKALVFGGSPYTVLATDSSVNCNAAGGNVVINLPATTGAGKEYFFVKIDTSAFTCTVNRAGADTIEGSASVVLLAQYDSLLIRDASVGSWLKVSPKIPGSAGQIIYNTNGSNFGAIRGTTADVITSVDNGPSSRFSIVDTWNGSSNTSNYVHAFDASITWNGSTNKMNTFSSFYGTATNSATAGGVGHFINVVSRLNMDGAGTDDEDDGYYCDIRNTANDQATHTLTTCYFALSNTMIGKAGTPATYPNYAGFRQSRMTWSANTTSAVEQGLVIDMPVLDSSTNNPAAYYGVRIGGATKATHAVALGINGGELYLQQGIEQTLTLDNTANSFLTTGGFTTGGVTSAYRFNGFCTQATTCAWYDGVMTNNVASSTPIMMNIKLDNGGGTTPTSMTTAKFMTSNSGGGTVTKAIINNLVNSGGGTNTDLTALQISDMNVGVVTNIKRAIDQLGTGDWMVWKGPHSFQQTTAPGSAVASGMSVYADSTARELEGATNGGTTFGIFARVGCQTSQKAETAADASVLSCTPVSVAGRYRIRFTLSLSAASAATLGWTITYTDSNGNAQTPTNLSLYQLGAAAPALTFTTSAAGNYYGFVDVDVNNAGTAIVVKLTFTGTSFTGKASATIEKLI